MNLNDFCLFRGPRAPAPWQPGPPSRAHRKREGQQFRCFPQDVLGSGWAEPQGPSPGGGKDKPSEKALAQAEICEGENNRLKITG